MRSVLRSAVAVALLACGCCGPSKFAADSLIETWDSPEVSIKRYAEAGVAADPALKDDPTLPASERAERTQARERRLRTIEEFGLLLKEVQASAQ
jgi:hypothetical protein